MIPPIYVLNIPLFRTATYFGQFPNIVACPDPEIDRFSSSEDEK